MSTPHSGNWGRGRQNRGIGRDLDGRQAEPVVCEIAHRHIPIDTSLCALPPQVRIYGFVATGLSIFSRVGVWHVWKWNVNIVSPTKDCRSIVSCQKWKDFILLLRGQKSSSIFCVLPHTLPSLFTFPHRHNGLRGQSHHFTVSYYGRLIHSDLNTQTEHRDTWMAKQQNKEKSFSYGERKRETQASPNASSFFYIPVITWKKGWNFPFLCAFQQTEVVN